MTTCNELTEADWNSFAYYHSPLLYWNSISTPAAAALGANAQTREIVTMVNRENLPTPYFSCSVGIHMITICTLKTTLEQKQNTEIQ